MKVTEGPNAGKLCLLDFGLVAEVPVADREAMVSATIHLANRDWGSLIDDFVALDFLPADCDRGVIIPVMDRVLSPYLRGGGAKSFNFQVCVCGVWCGACWGLLRLALGPPTRPPSAACPRTPFCAPCSAGLVPGLAAHHPGDPV